MSSAFVRIRIRNGLALDDSWILPGALVLGDIGNIKTK